jgi:chromosome partitioning protein
MHACILASIHCFLLPFLVSCRQDIGGHMKTLVIAAQKGGAGKTTLARNLAVAAAQDGQRVLALDLDPQQSFRAWWRGRESDAPMMLADDPAPHALRDTLAAARGRFDLVVIDTPPAAPSWLTETLRAADLALIPVRPSPDDLRAVGATIAALGAAAVPFAFVMSQTPRAKLTDEAVRVLAQHGRIAPVNIAQRVIYAETAATGQGVTETSDTKAVQELAAIWGYVKGLIE